MTSGQPGEYIEQPNWFVEGKLDVAAFQEAWALTAAARDNLRLSVQINAQTRQLVQRAGDIRPDIRIFDWQATGTVAADTDERLRHLLAADRAEPFDLGRGPLWRIHLVRLAERRHWLCWTIHHLISDGWSATLVLADAFRAYGELAARRTVTPIVAPPFAGYLGWIDRQNIRNGEKYWRERLSGLRADRPARFGPGRTPAAWPTRIDRELDQPDFERLREVARRHRLTLGTVTGGLWAALQAARSGDLDVLYGSVTAGRPGGMVGVERISGPFLTVLPTRATVEPDIRLAEWLGRQQSLQAADRDHAHAVNFAVGPRTGPRRPESLLALQSYPDAARFDGLIQQATGGVLSVSDGIFAHSLTHYPLDVTILPTARTLRLSMHAEQAGVDPVAAEEIADQYVRALTSGMQASTVAELLDLLHPAVPTPRAVPTSPDAGSATTDVVAMFAAQVKRQPDAEALRDPRGSLTFRQLDRPSRDLAAALRAAGTGPERVVGLDMARGAGLVTAMLAVWRAGGAFFILDPEEPPQRRRLQLARAGVMIVVTGSPATWTWTGLPVVDVAEPLPAVPAFADDRPAPRQLAYVTATSGTTGEPRVVLNEHRGLADHVTGQLAAAYPDARLRRMHVLGTAPVTFDAFLDNVLPALAAGHVSVLNDDQHRWHPASLRALLAAGEEYVLDCAPSQLATLVAVEPTLLSDAALVGLVFGGERPPDGLWAELRGGRLAASSFSVYGATECSVGSTLCVPGASAGNTIGDPAPGTRIYLLDAHLRPLPPGTVGTVHIAGPGVGRGYAGAPAATAGAFLPDPWSTTPGARMYATGDLGCETAAGIEFRGRRDAQVKLRGLRIDLAEVEQAFERQAGIGRAFAVAAGADGQSLGCLLQVEPGVTLDGALAAVRRELPAHLVPTLIGLCEAMPLTAAGKIDRSAARDLIAATRAPAERDEAGTQAERAMGAIWAEVLGVDQVDPEDDFFALGGHSLSAIALSTRISQSLAESHAIVREILESRTPRALCERLGDFSAGPAGFEPLPCADRSADLDMPAAQRRLWLLDARLPDAERPAYNTAVRLRFDGPLDEEALRDALARVLASHDTFRMRYSMAGSRPVVRVTDVRTVELLDVLRRDSGSEPPLFNLSRPPLVRGHLSPAGEDGRRHLTLVLHHICVDGASLPILHDELRTEYARCLDGHPPLPRPSERDLLDYTEWQRTRTAAEGSEAALRYWIQELAGARPAFLPADRPASTAFGQAGPGRAETSFRTLDAGVRASLHERSTALGCTPFELCTAVLAVLLAAYSGQEDVLLGVPVSGRWHPQTERMLGFFSNTLALRLDTTGDPSLTELGVHVADRMREALVHQAISFDDVVGGLPSGHPLRHPGLGVLVQFGRQTDGLTREWAGGLTATVEPATDPLARFPLSLNLTDLGDRIHLECAVDTRSYTAAAVEAFLDRFTRLLAAGCAEPRTPLGTLLRRPGGRTA